MEAMENIFNNIEILNKIFQYTNYHEQLKLIRVCRSFQDVIINYVWKLKYKEIEVIRTSEYYILTNRIDKNLFDLEILKKTRIILSDKEFDEFLSLNANNVQQFILWVKCSLENGSNTPLVIKYKLPNLNSLTIVCDMITDKNFILMSTLCPQLEKLYLKKCVNSEKQHIRLGNHIKMENLQNIKTLKYLEVNDGSSLEVVMPYVHSDIMEIFVKLKLLQIQVQGLIMTHEIHNDFGLLKESKKIINHFQALQLGPCYSKSSVHEFTKTYLNRLKNLIKLTITSNIFYTLEDKDFSNIVSNNLIYLSLQYIKFTNFTWPKTLDELILRNCKGLTCSDLEHILCDMKLKAFTSVKTEYAGTMANNITAPKTLEFLEFDAPQIGQLFELMEFNGFENVSFLKCNQNNNFKFISKKCPNLRQLSIADSEDVAIDDLCELKSLEKLEIKYATYNITNLLQILKHSTLTHFVIEDFNPTADTINYDECTDLKTNLLLINIPLNMFHLQEFWLDLFNMNPQLHLMFHTYSTLVEYTILKTIINHLKFPDRLKTIKIRGFNFDCQHLRDHFDVTLDKLLRMELFIDFTWESFYIIL